MLFDDGVEIGFVVFLGVLVDFVGFYGFVLESFG